jgi:hypothetical protein
MDPVVSVPHTGTRSLARSLGVMQFYHFGQNDRDIANLSHFHFPMRDPLATSLSWRGYQLDRDSFDEFRRWELAIAWMADHDHTVHMIEDYPNVPVTITGGSEPINAGILTRCYCYRKWNIYWNGLQFLP